MTHKKLAFFSDHFPTFTNIYGVWSWNFDPSLTFPIIHGVWSWNFDPSPIFPIIHGVWSWNFDPSPTFPNIHEVWSWNSDHSPTFPNIHEVWSWNSDHSPTFIPHKSGSKRAYLVQNFLLIIFLVLVCWYLVPPTHKLAKTFKKIDFQLLFSRDWDIFGTNGYLRWTRLKKFFKMSISCFFRKNHRMDLI